MGGESLAQLGPTLVSLLALLLSLFNLYLQRRGRRPHLEIRARYSYRADNLDATSEAGTLPQIYDDSQEGLYLLLGDFLRQYGFGIRKAPRWCGSPCPTKATRPST